VDLGEQFVRDGYIKIEQAFPADLAARCRDLLWLHTGCDPVDPSTWTAPVVRIRDQADPLFAAAANTDRLREAYDALVGPDHWMPRTTLGTFPVRFPSDEPPGDDGWHIDAGFPGADPSDFFTWRINITSRGRALLMLFLFSDVTVNDAPTRIRVGSHVDVARILSPYDEVGLTMMETSERARARTAGHEIALATGRPGDVYLCHPFLVHAAQAHHGTTPRFLAQPCLFSTGGFAGQLDPFKGASPVELAIRKAIATGSA
jgi:phytanoyl-CoA dioxygenase PhyH